MITFPLTIQFIGTCTHFNRKTGLGFDLPVPHRIVFPKTDASTITVEGPNGPLSFTFALQPQLLLPNQTILLSGVRMYIDGDKVLEPEFGSRCIPNLKNIWPGMELNLPVVLEGASPAAAYFDVFAGNIATFNEEEAAAAKLTLEFPFPTAVLVMEGFDGTVISEITISLPQVITIENHPTPGVESDNGQVAEIQLNFLVAKQLPPPEFPDIDKKLKEIVDCLNLKDADAGPGCSNSQYP